MGEADERRSERGWAEVAWRRRPERARQARGGDQQPRSCDDGGVVEQRQERPHRHFRGDRHHRPDGHGDGVASAALALEHRRAGDPPDSVGEGGGETTAHGHDQRRQAPELRNPCQNERCRALSEPHVGRDTVPARRHREHATHTLHRRVGDLLGQVQLPHRSSARPAGLQRALYPVFLC
jgi:hypothetical protein